VQVLKVTTQQTFACDSNPHVEKCVISPAIDIWEFIISERGMVCIQMTQCAHWA